VFSLVPFSQGWWGAQNQAGIPRRSWICRAIGARSSHRRGRSPCRSPPDPGAPRRSFPRSARATSARPRAAWRAASHPRAPRCQDGCNGPRLPPAMHVSSQAPSQDCRGSFHVLRRRCTRSEIRPSISASAQAKLAAIPICRELQLLAQYLVS